MSTASKVAEDKAKYPERYCPHTRCLWRTGGTLCVRHEKPFGPAWVRMKLEESQRGVSHG